MGLAVLPARLREEMSRLADALVSGADLRSDEVLSKHADWAEEFSKAYDITAGNVNEIIQNEIGKVFAEVLEHAGVFKRNEKGREYFSRFIDYVNG